MKTNQPKKRMAGVELLRIISMLMIIMLHLLGHGGVLQNAAPGSADYYIAYAAEGLCYVAVNCYVLICGYFQCEQHFNFKKLLILWLRIFFWSVAVFAALCISGQIAFSKTDLLRSALPVLSNRYGFVTAYFGLMLLSPFLNILIKAINRAQHLMLLLLITVICSVLPVLGLFNAFSQSSYLGGGSGIILFALLYLIAAYIRRYPPKQRPLHTYFSAYVITALLAPLLRFAIEKAYDTGAERLMTANRQGLFYAYNSLTVMAAAIALFMLFMNLRIKDGRVSRAILCISPLTFGVYLIHDNPYMRGVLWRQLDVCRFMGKWYFALLAIATVIAIFAVCAAAEFIRSRLFRRLESSKITDRLCGRETEFKAEFYNKYKENRI